jgi:DNA-binding response OmpR family regulator
MPTVWIVTNTNPQLVESFRLAGWDVEALVPADLMPARQSHVRDLEVLVFEAIEKPFFDKCLEVCRERVAPVLTIVANVAFAEKAVKAGADDFMIAPVDPVEVLLRAQKLAHASSVVRVGDLVVDLAGRRVKRGGRLVKLSPVEFRLLAYLAEHIGKVVGYDELLDAVWQCGAESGGTLEQVKTGVRRLRQKIEPDPHNPQFVISIAKEGYRLRSQTQWEDAILSY